MKWGEMTAQQRAALMAGLSVAVGESGIVPVLLRVEEVRAIRDTLATLDALAPLVRDVEAIAWDHDDECLHRHGCDASCDGDTGCESRFGASSILPCDCSSGRVLALLAALRPLIGGAA